MGSILKHQIAYTVCEVLSLFVGLRFSSLWQLKQYLAKGGRHSILSRVYYHLIDKKGSYIGVSSKIAECPVFPHGITGVFISKNAVIGVGCTIFQQVTIGSNTLGDSAKQGSPIIGNNVYIGAGAKIVGAVTIGDNCRIGAGTVVVKDMPPNTVAVGAAARFIRKENLTNDFVNIEAFNQRAES